jgi:hypothetical protein
LYYNSATQSGQVNRQSKREADGLGKLVKVTEQAMSNGNFNQETSYTYNLLDKLTQVNQGRQYRKFKNRAAHPCHVGCTIF